MSHQTELNTSPFSWGEIELSEVTFISGTPHITRRSIGKWLEYADPQNAIDVILKRNPHIDHWSVPVRLTGTDGKNYDGFVYHPVGFMLIVFESGQSKAHQMKQAVAEFVWKFAGPQEFCFKERQGLMKLRMALLDRLNKTRDAFVRDALLHDLREVSLALGVPVPDVTRLGKDANQLELAGV